MKNNKTLIALAAGAAVAGIAGLWLASRRGKSVTQKLKTKSEKMIDEAEDILTEAKDRFDHLRSDLFKNKRRTERVPEDIVM